MLHVAANFCNLKDAAGRVVYTPSLSGADQAGVLPDWLELQRQAGSTHLPFGPFTPGPAYPGAAFSNPDLTDPQDLRAFVLDLLNQPSASGKGFIPLLMLDGGGPHPETRWGQWQAWGDALTDVQASLAVCPAWEPVVGDWTSKQLSDGLGLAHAAFPQSVLCWHGSPTRWVGSSNPVEPTDPWHGGESVFYDIANGQRIDLPLYQTPHGADLYRPCTCPNWRQPFGHVDACWLNRLEDGVARCGTGYHGWRVLSGVVLFETVAYEFFRNQATSEQARQLAALAKERVYDKWNVPFLGGNGLP